MRRNGSAQVALPDATISGSGIRSPIPSGHCWNEVDLGILVQIIVVRTQLVATAYAPPLFDVVPSFRFLPPRPCTQPHQRLPRNRINRAKTLPASPFVTIVTSFPLTELHARYNIVAGTRSSRERQGRRRENSIGDDFSSIERKREKERRSFCQEERFSRNDQQCRPLILLLSSGISDPRSRKTRGIEIVEVVERCN